MKKFILPAVLLTLSCVGTASNAENVRPAPNSLKTITEKTPETTPQVNCNYTVPAGTPDIDNAILIQWAESATKQSFDFKHDRLEKQLDELKSCFTDSGWQSFKDALQKSGNVTAIKSQKLNVNSSVTGTSTLSKIKDNQWKVNIPFEVIYQNDKETLKQSLIVDLMVERKTSGQLGVMQIVVAPDETKTTAPNTSTSTNTITKDSKTKAATK